MSVSAVRSAGLLTPYKFLDFSLSGDIALVLLNAKWFPSSEPSLKFLDFFEKLWKKSGFRASVDGGTNVLHNINKFCKFQFVPDMISGDFDSLYDDVKEFYKKKGSEVVHTPDQNFTDFTKCLKLLSQKLQFNRIEKIVCLVGESDRVDHVVSNVNTLFCSRSYFPPHVSVCLLSCDACVHVLSAGKTYIELTMYDLHEAAPWCSLVAAQRPATVTTSGLQNNLTNQRLTFSTLSFSQTKIIDCKQFTVETDQSLILTLPFRFY